MKSRLQTNKKGRAGVLSVRSAVCLFTALAAVVVIALAWWSRAYAAEIPDGYALDASTTILNLAVNGSYEGITRNGDKEFGITGAQGFVTLARVSQSNSLEGYTFQIFASDTWELTVDAGDLEKSFYGIGNDEHPFKGKIYMAKVPGSTYLKLSGWNVLFNNLSNEASITKETDKIDLCADINAPFALCDTLTITKDSPLDISAFRFAAREVQDGSVKGVVKGNKTAGLVAGKVTGRGTCAVDLSPCFKDGAQYALETASGSAGGLFGVIEKDASVSVTTGNLNILVSSADAGNVGLLVGENKGTFTVSSESTYTGSATAATDYAAGLVGVNANTGTVNFANSVTVNAFTATGAYAGGVAGKSDGEITVAARKTCTVSGSTFTSAATLPMLGGAVGQATAAPVGSFALSGNTFDKSGNIGGFIGSFIAEKAANFTDVTVTGATFNGTGAADHSVGGYFGLISGKNAVTLTSNKASAFTFNSLAAGSYGGVIGTVKANSVVTVGGGMTVTNTFASGGFSGSLGGAVGCVGQGAYCKLDNLTLNNTMNAALQAGVGDLVGQAAAKALVDVGRVTYTNNGQASVLVSATGVGTVLRLAGTITDNSNSSGHIVRTQNQSLLYADTGYTFTRKGTLTSNDVGNYGQILRNDKLHILAFDAASHTVSVQNPLTSSTNITLSSGADAAKLALTLHTHGAVSGVNGIQGDQFNKLRSATITLIGDVDLRGSGVEQFTPSNEIMSFTGTIDGNDKTLTLSHGESARSNTEDNANVGILKGGVNVRKFMGAFSALSGATVKNLTVDGDVRHYADAPEGFFFGGLACYATNSITIDQCNTLLKINLSQGLATNGRSIYVGGLVGSIQNATVKIKNSTTNASIQQENECYRIWRVFLGGMVGRIDGIAKDVIFTGNTISASITQNQNVTAAHVGGCFGDLICNNYIHVDMTGTKAVNASVTSASSASAGGLIGHTVQKCKLVLDGTWQGTVSSGNASVGGLIYDLDGKLTVNTGFSVNGSVFTSNNATKGILVAEGTQAFVVVNCDPSGFQGVKADGFDLFVGRNIASRASMNVAATGGLVSVETGITEDADIGRIPATSSWYSMISARQNSNTRYYFNIAKLDYTDGNYKPGAVAKTQADVIYWHVYDYVQGALPDYALEKSFYTAITDITGADKDIDMTNYSFYPTKKEGVTFDFSGHKLTFGYAVADLPRTGQMFGIQSGILSDVIATNESITASLTNITLAGTVYPVNGRSGAFICGKVVGNRTATVTADANFRVEKVFFEGLTVDGAATPLLIDTIGSNVTGALTSVSQYTQGTYEAVGKQNNYKNGAKAASALIGKGGVANENGSTASSNISVTFKNIVFAAEEGKSIFTKASYFEAINCVNGTGAYIYNFNLAEDWDGGNHKYAVTYGTEISTNPKQYEYYDQEILVDPNTQPTQHGGTNTAFSNGYMPYVLTTMDGGTSLRVNRKSVNFDIGWGTYEHPYIIERAAQLEELTKLVSMSGSHSFQPDWVINYPKASGTALDYTDCDVYTASTSGTLTTSGGTKTLKAETLREYLRGAYYKISAPMELSSEFTGIGTEQYPFHGVIVGSGTVITMPDNTNVGNTGYCGFINVANGCAVYGLELSYEKVGLSGSFSSWDSPTSRAFSTKRAATSVAHFGGAIGWIVGGDNVLDHVTVRVNSLTPGHKTSVFGGYVGLISGGGVTVRSLGPGVDKDETAENSQYFYYAPYVGKAFSGYAISDDQEYKNTEKYASIAYIAAKQTTGAFTAQGDQGGAFTLANAADLMMLGYSMYSGALSDETNSLSYGADVLSRSGNYAYVGEKDHPNVTITAGRYAEDARTDGDNLIRRYFGIPAGTGISRKGKITATLTGAEYDMSQFGNAFRGLGSPYLGTECYNVLEAHGAATGTLVKLNASLKQYCYQASSKYEPDSVHNMALVMEPTGGGPVLISNITVSGTISLSVYDIANNTELTKKMSHWLKLDGSNNKETLFCLGGFLGYSGGAKFTDVALKDLTIHSPGWAGGLVASEHNQNGSSVNGCVIDSVKLEGLQSTGSVYAFLRAGSNTQLSNVKVTNAQVQTKVSEFSDANNDTYNAATGGLIGCIMNGTISVTDSSVSGSSVQFVSKKTTSSSYNGNAGGFIGTSRASVTFSNCTLDGAEVVACAGYTANAPYPTEYTNSTVDVNGISDGTKNAIAYALSSDASAAGNAGGFVGVTAQTNTYTNCVVKSDTAPAVVLGYRNGSGFVGNSPSAVSYSFTDASVQATKNPLYIVGRSCSAGLLAWDASSSGGTIQAEKVKVTGTNGGLVYILGTKRQESSKGDVFAGGLFGVVNKTAVTITDAEVSGCVIASQKTAGVINNSDGKATELNNIKAYNNYIQSTTNYSLAGVINTVSGTVNLNGLYLADNMIRNVSSSSNIRTGGITDTITDKGVLNGCNILMKNNDMAFTGSAKSIADILKMETTKPSNVTGTDYERVGLIGYENKGTANILALSVEEDDNVAKQKRFRSESSSSSSTVIFAGYGAPSVFETEYFGKKNTAYTPAQALADHGVTPVKTDKLNGDAVTKTQGSATPDYLNANLEGWAAWKDKTVKLEDTGIKTLSDLTADKLRITQNTDLPVLSINGATQQTMSSFLNLLTGGGFGAMGSAYTLTVQADRYTLGNDGTLSPQAKGDGSVLYDGQKFTAGKYDDLESENKSLTVLTLTFQSSAVATQTYSMNVVVYYPQILEYTSNISALEGEVYQLSSFLTAPKNFINVSAGSKYSLYVEYAYNDTAKKIENFNFDKRIESGTPDDSSGDKKNAFTAGTKFVLVDLNSRGAYGYKSYYYTADKDTYTLDFSSFQSEAGKPFTVKLLPEVVQNMLVKKEHLCKDANYGHVERYLLMVIPQTAEQLMQYTLRATVAENDRNIIVREDQNKGKCSVNVWGKATGKMNLTPATTFSYVVGKELVVNAHVQVDFPHNYISAMHDRDIYGTHVFKIMDANNKAVSLPAGTKALLTGKDGKTLLATRVTTPTSTVRYELDNIVSLAPNDSLTDDFVLTLDFSEVSPADFSGVFTDGGAYKLQDEFYISSDRAHYTNGSKIEGSTFSFTAKTAVPVKLTVIPVDRKSQAINMGGVKDSTDSGKILFDLVADFSAVPEKDRKNIESAKVEFSLYQKQYDETKKKYVYSEKNLPGPLGTVDADGRTVLPLTTDWKATGQYTLSVNLDYVLEQMKTDYQGILSNYRLMAKVTGLDASGNAVGSYSAESYFVFLLCDIDNQIGA
ncbi:hypothetical protein [Vescimonas sp.]|uniref:hypothetical protein n=1 Tax=Vescimonas sp. TaxID=2892404 RepID=UPI00307C6DED